MTRIALFTTEEVQPPSTFSVVRRASVDQMVLEDAGACRAQPGAPIVALGGADGSEMLVACENVTPTWALRSADYRELGHYIGIRRQGALVAMAGERMRLHGFTEISARCALEPAYRGHGFAAEASSDRWLHQSPCGPKSRFCMSSVQTMRLSLSTASWALRFGGGCISAVFIQAVAG